MRSHLSLPCTLLKLSCAHGGELLADQGNEANYEKDQGKRPLSREERVERAWMEYYKRQANQRRAELQQVLHRSSALCTLAHGLLLDRAANDEMLQVRFYISPSSLSCSVICLLS